MNPKLKFFANPGGNQQNRPGHVFRGLASTRNDPAHVPKGPFLEDPLSRSEEVTVTETSEPGSLGEIVVKEISLSDIDVIPPAYFGNGAEELLYLAKLTQKDGTPINIKKHGRACSTRIIQYMREREIMKPFDLENGIYAICSLKPKSQPKLQLGSGPDLMPAWPGRIARFRAWWKNL